VKKKTGNKATVEEGLNGIKGIAESGTTLLFLLQKEISDEV